MNPHQSKFIWDGQYKKVYMFIPKIQYLVSLLFHHHDQWPSLTMNSEGEESSPRLHYTGTTPTPATGGAQSSAGSRQVNTSADMSYNMWKWVSKFQNVSKYLGLGTVTFILIVKWSHLRCLWWWQSCGPCNHENEAQKCSWGWNELLFKTERLN